MPKGFYRAEGTIKNVNTIEDYRKLDKNAILNQAGRTVCSDGLSRIGSVSADSILQIWDAIKDGTIYSCPSLLASFVVICYADLKRYKFTYLFGFPALHSEPAWHPIASAQETSATDNLGNHLSPAESTALVDSVQTWRYRVDARQFGFFLAKRVRKSTDSASFDAPQSRGSTPETSPYTLDYSWVVGSLSQYENGFFEGTDIADQFVCFADPSTYPEYPGWMLRNLLILIRKRWGLSKVQVLCYRDIQPRREDAQSLILNLTLGDSPGDVKMDDSNALEEAMPRVSGWERSDKGKIVSRIANLGEYMDPERYSSCKQAGCGVRQTNMAQARGSSRRSQPKANQVANLAGTEFGRHKKHQMPSSRCWYPWELRSAKPIGKYLGFITSGGPILTLFLVGLGCPYDYLRR